MLTSGRPHSGPFGSRLRATLVASLVCALALLALPALASASWNLTVAKTTVPSGGTGFGFTVSGPTSVAAINGVNDGGSVQRTGLQEGTSNGDNYTITENDPGAGYAVTSISCTGTGVDVRSTNLGTRTVVVRANIAGSGTPNVTCTFTNTAIASTGTIKVRKGGDRNTGSNAELDYASPLQNAVFEYSTTSNFAAIAGTITTDGTGAGTAVVNNGTYYVREATAPAGFTDVSPLQSLFFDPTSGVPAASQPYVSKVVVSGGQTTEAFPNQTPDANAANWDSATAGNTGSPFVNVRNNAVFPDYCGLKIQLVLDRSGSIDQYKTSYRDAAQAFVDALDGTPSQIGITSFSRGVNENAVGGNGGQTGNLNAQAPLSIDTGSPLNAQILKNKIADVYSDPGGGTDWDAALRDASTRVGFTPTAPSATDKPDIVVFITDGNPTAHGGPNSDNGSNVHLMDLTYGIASANLLKNVTAHDTTKVKMLAVGVGTGVTAGNLKAVSGPNDDSNPDPDYAASSVDALVLKLQELASQTCGSRIIVRKTLLGAGVDNTPQAGWNYTATSPSTVSYSDPDNTAPYSTHGSPAQLTVALNNVPVTGTTAQITEDAAGQPLPAGEYAYTSTVCRLKGSAGWDANNPFTTGTIVGSAVTRGVSLTGIARGSDYYCTATNTKQKPVVTLTKTAVASPINAGDNASFTITASNAGPGSATGVVVTDNLPAAYNWTENSADCTIAGAVGSQVMTCNFGTIASGANKAVTITAPTTATACATIPNTASATATNTDPIANANASIVCNKPSVTTTKTAAASPINAGDNASFTITTSNAGPGTATGVVVTDNLPAAYNWTENSADCTIAGAVGSQVMTCNFGTIASGANKAVTITAPTSFAACATIPNTASTTGTNTGTIANANASIVCNKPSVTTTKTAAASPINAGDNASFTITTSNAGPGTATGVVVTDNLPAAYNWTENSADCTIAGAVGSQVMTCNFGTIASGANKAVTITAPTSFAACATIPNTASTTGTNTGTIANANASIVCNKPNLTVDKTPDNQTISAGTDAEFTITVGNSGPGVAKTATLSDPLPASGNWSISQAVNAGTCAITGPVGTQVLNCTFGDLASGATRTLKVKSATSAAACATYDNTATASSTNNDPGSVQNSGKITCQAPGLAVDKTPDNQTIDAGDDAEFTITLSNNGPGVATGATLSDPLPASGNWSISQAVNAGTCAITGPVGTQVLNCTFGDLAANATRTLKVKSATTAAACATYDNTATGRATNTADVTNSGKITCRKPDVKVSKTPDNQTIDAGDDAEFTITAQNDGPGLAKSVTLSDTLPANGNWSISQAVNAGTCAITGPVGTQVLNCTFGDLASGATRTLKVKSATTATSCGIYDNTATASSTNNNPASIDDSGKITCRKPDLKVSKTPDNQTIDAGDDAEFTITAQNDGPGLAKSVTLSDTLPANGNWSISQAVNAGTCAITGPVGTQVLNCTFGDLASGATRTLKVKSATTATSCGIYDNTATASSTNNNPASIDDSGKITCRKPDLKVSKTPDNQTIDAGDDAEFTITAQNDGPGLAKSVTLSDTLPANGNWSISQAVNAGTCAITGPVGTQVLNCTFGDLASGATRTLKVKSATTATSCGIYDNTATASSTNNNPASIDDSGKITCRKPDLKVSKTPDNQTIDAGDDAEFTITAQNDGPGLAKSVTLSDTLPANGNWSISQAVNAGTCAITGPVGTQVLNCTFGDLASGATRTLKVKSATTATSCGIYDNTATASSTNNNPASIDDSGKITCRKPGLKVTKTADADSVSAGSAIGFTVKTENTGPGTATGVTLNDPLPNGVDWTIDPANTDCQITGTGDDQVLSCDFGTLADGASETVHVTATTSYQACTTYDNEATASATNAPNAKDDATTQCLKPDLKVEKTADAATVDAGDPIGFTVKTTNNGPGTATSVTLNDPLPNGVDWSIDPANSDCEITGTGDDQVLSCDFGTLADDASETVHISAATSFENCTSYDNEATASATNAPNAKDDASITCRKSGLKVTKTADADSVSAGSAIGFTVKTENTGPGTATGVTLNDPLPNGVDWTIDPANTDCQITGTGDDQVLSCDFGTLADGASETVHVTATTSYANCTTYDNEATASATNAPNAKDDATITCLKPELAVEKTADDASVSAGSAIGFTVKTTNNGPGTATGVTLNDPLPNGVDWSIDPANSDCEITGTGDDQVLSCDFGTLADDASETVHVTATTSYANCTTYDNEATASATNAPNAKDDATITCLKPELAVEKTADDASVSAGSAIGFTVKTTNNGPGTATGVTLNDPLPNGVDWSIDPANSDCEITGTGDDQVLSCDFGTLADDASETVHVTATTSYQACTTYDNEATASATNAPNAKDDATTQCLKPDLKVEKTADAATVDAGDPIGFTVKTTNNGPGTATSVTLNDPLPNGVDWSIDPANSDCEITGTGDDQVLSCDFGTLADDASETVHISAATSFENCTSYDNEATASATNAPNAKDDASITCRKSGLKVTKTADADSVSAGSAIGFTVKTENTGPGTATGVTLNDPLPNGVDWTIDPANTDCQITGTGDDQVLSCDFGTLADGASETVHVTATTSYANCTTYDNEATASATNAPNAKDDATTQCLKPDLKVEKTADKVTVDAGDPVGFTVKTTNNGAGTATGVTLNDPLPNGVDWTISPANTDCEITGTGDDQVLSCDFGSLEEGASAEVHVTATTTETACTTYDNEATASATNAPNAKDDATIECQKPGLGVDKAALQVTVDAGDDVSFDITTSNAGPGTAKGVTLNDPLPNGVDWSIAPANADCEITGTGDDQVLTCDFGDIPAGESRKVTVTASTSFEQCTEYANTATADAINAPAKTDSDTITCQKPNVSLLKKATKATVDAGDPIEFTITATNSGLPGTGNAKGVVIKDDLPGNAGADWSVVSPQADCAISGAVGSEQLTCAPVDLAPGASYDVVVTSATSYDNCGVYDNTATFSPAQPRQAIDEDPIVVTGNAGSGESNTATITCRKPDLKVEKTADDAVVDAGEAVGFTMTTTNGGPGTAKSVTLKDALPDGLTWSIAPANSACEITGTGDDQVLTCDFGDLADDASKSVHVTATTSFQACATYENKSATASATNHPDVSDDATTRCRQPATVRIDKVVEGEPGSETKFAFTSDLDPNAQDQGTAFQLADSDAPKVYTVRPGTYQVTESDPRGLGYVLTSASCAPTPREDDIAPRKNVNTPEDGKLSFELAENADVTCTFVNTKLTSAIEVVKSPKTQSVYLDGTATYTYKVTNTGSSDLSNVTATDDRCAPLTRTDAGNNDPDNWLEQGETWTYTCSVSAATLFGSSTTPVTNTVTATGIDRKETKVQDTDTAVTNVLIPGIAIDKTGPATATAGELITYDLAVTNTGNTSFEQANVKLTDTVVTPSGGVCSGDLATPKDKKGDQTPGQLNPGETWVYQCQVQTKVGDTKVTNKGAVNGTDSGGKVVTANDTAETTLAAPAGNVSPAGKVSGRARLTGSVGCVASSYAKATVSGSSIKQVTFYVNGRKAKTLKKPNSGRNYQLRLRTKSLKYGTYKVRAKVQFVTGASPQTRNLDLQFNRCRPRVIKPKFTG